MEFPTQIIQQSFIGTSFALLSGFLIWLIKSSYEKYTKENLSILKIERTYIENLSSIRDNIYLIEEWIKALRQNRRYSCLFSDLVIDNESHFPLSDVKLVDLVVKTNFSQKRLNDDLQNLYSDYKTVILGIAEGKFLVTDEGFKFYNEYTTTCLRKILEKIPDIEDNIIKTLAYIRKFSRVKFHSIFGYYHIVSSKYVFPMVTEKGVNREFEKIKKEIESKK